MNRQVPGEFTEKTPDFVSWESGLDFIREWEKFARDIADLCSWKIEDIEISFVAKVLPEYNREIAYCYIAKNWTKLRRRTLLNPDEYNYYEDRNWKVYREKRIEWL
jgi:hypothetical protein